MCQFLPRHCARFGVRQETLEASIRRHSHGHVFVPELDGSSGRPSGEDFGIVQLVDVGQWANPFFDPGASLGIVDP